ncbi:MULTISPECIES: GNAT family N-acetyltransferase [Robertmurraya]|uniref:GNAT family N-acetyltransferase n=1 Tax=Robertmurraya beringensis TaxID=641660 RepID=A0ABV6KSM8_9BACI
MERLKKPYLIRNFEEQDANQIAKFDFISMLAYRYNGDYTSDNIFCAVSEEGEVFASAHIAPDQSWGLIEDPNKSLDFEFKLQMDLAINENTTVPKEAVNELMDAVMIRAKMIRSQYPNKKITLRHTISSDDFEEMDFYLSKGFIAKENHLVMKRDLTEPIPSYPLPANIRVMNWKMESQEEQESYLRAEAAGDPNGICWSLNHLQWTKSGAEWATFTAFDGQNVVGSVMTWGLGEKRSATENIFVLPNWRRMGIAKALITEALTFLKEKGKTEATLGVFGDNRKAISLYQSLGYRMFYTIIEFGYDL